MMEMLCSIRLPNQLLQSPISGELSKRFPESWNARTGFVRLSESDPHLRGMIELITVNGYRLVDRVSKRIPSNDTSLPIEIGYSRRYDSSDLDACSYLQMEAFRSPPGVGTLKGAISWDIRNTEFIEKDDFASGDDDCVCCPDRVRRSLETADLIGLRFRETVPEDPDEGPTTWDKYGPPWWEITTDVVMPPMSPSMILYDGYWKRVEAGDQHAMFVFDPVDPRIGKPELHYRAADLAAIEPFDIAKTFEKYRAVIVSKRFYDVCVSLGLKAKWTPVRVEQ